MKYTCMVPYRTFGDMGHQTIVRSYSVAFGPGKKSCKTSENVRQKKKELLSIFNLNGHGRGFREDLREFIERCYVIWGVVPEEKSRASRAESSGNTCLFTMPDVNLKFYSSGLEKLNAINFTKTCNRYLFFTTFFLSPPDIDKPTLRMSFLP